MTFTRRQFLQTSASAVAGTALLQLPVGAQAPAQAPPATRFEDVRRNVGIFIGQGGTIGWLVTPDGAVVVDTQFPQTAAPCLEGLKGKSPRGVELLINTHHHGDHVGGNSVFRPAVKRIVQHERCAEYHKKTTAENAPAQAYADVTFGQNWSANVGDETVSAHYFGPGHTGGDAVILFEKANVVHMGDLMFNRRHPFVDRANGASIRGWISILEQVSKKHGDAAYIFGHAKEGLAVTGSAKDLLHFRDYFSAVLEHTQKGIKAGQSKEQITALEALPGFTEYASSPPRLTLAGVLGVAYDELTSK